MKVTKATNIQIRLEVVESQQLNSKKRNTRAEKEFSANEKMPTSNYTQKQNKIWIDNFTAAKIIWEFM